MIFDTHVHYNLEPLAPFWRRYWQKAQAHGIVKSIVVGADLVSSQAALAIAQQEPNLFAAVGIHPDEGQAAELNHQLSTIKELAETKNSKLVAIGEIGLDYFRLADNSNPAVQAQKQLLQTQLELANELNLPVIIHVRDREIPETATVGNAYWDALQLIKVHYQFQKPFVFHCLSGPLSYIEQALEIGAYIGVAGNVTYKNAHHLREIVKHVPTDRLLVETDAPFLPPQVYRGQICEPWMIQETVKFLTADGRISEQQLVLNAQTCFGLPA